jgi:competence protein ComEC
LRDLPAVPPVLAAFVAGDLVLQQFASLPPAGALCAAALAGLALCGLALQLRRRWPGRCQRRVTALACAASLLIGFACTGGRAALRLADALDPADEGRDVRVQGVVDSLPAQFEGGTRFTARIERVLGVPGGGAAFAVPGRVALSWYGAPAAAAAAEATPATPVPPPTVLPAQRWEWTVRLHRPQGTVNPAGFDAEAWLFEQDIRAQGTVRGGARDAPPRLLAPWVWRFDPLVDRARAALRDRLAQLLQGRRHASVIIALVMGDQSAIPEQDWALYNRTGISHLVSISGLHITMIAALAALLAGAAWRCSPRLLRLASVPVVRAAAAIAGGLAYCLLAGWGVPAQRTLLMLSVVALGQCARARLGSAAILAWAAALVCLWDPWAVLASGFWLSFGAVACIFLACSGRLPPPPGWRSGLREGLRVQAAITVGQVPLTLAIFGQVSLVAPLANALAIPVVSYLVAPLALLGAGLAVCGPLLAPVAGGLLAGAETLFGWLGLFLQWLTVPGWSWFALPLPPLWSLAVAAAGCAWLLAPAGWPLRGLGLCGLLPLFVWPVPRPAGGELWVSALDVGQGMCIVLESSDRVVVFDAGPRYSPEADAGSRVLVPYLRARGLRRVDVLVVSHPDIDHAGGALSLLRSLPVGRVWSSVEPGHRLLGPAQDVTRCEDGQRLVLGALTLEMLHPPAALYAQARAGTNARSCVVLATLGAQRVLLTGDVPARQEAQLLARAAAAGRKLQVALLVAPHHGSHSSSSAALIAATAPRWVSMQLGYRNHYGHPHAEVLQRYRDQGVAIERSDEQGAVQWRLAATGATVERWRRDHARYWNNQPAAAAGTGASGLSSWHGMLGSTACQGKCR